MPRRSAKSPLGNKLSKALQSHAKDPTVVRGNFIDLPPGINGGVAKLVKARIGEYKSGPNQGEKFVYLAGIVVRPKEVNVMRRAWKDNRVVTLPIETVNIEGQRTSQTLPLCDTTTQAGNTTTIDEHVERMLNELRLLGGDEFTRQLEEGGDEEMLAQMLEDLEDEDNPVYFRFSTSGSTPTAQFPAERVWENWSGTKGLEDFSDEDSGEEEGSEIVEEEPDVEEQEESEPEKAGDGEEEGEEDLAALAEAADNDDEDAQVRLGELCEEADVNPEKYETWADVANVLLGSDGESGEDEGGEEEEEEEESNPPAKGDVLFFVPKGKRKPIEVEVTAVFTGNETCNLRSLDDKKLYKGISWERLSSE